MSRRPRAGSLVVLLLAVGMLSSCGAGTRADPTTSRAVREYPTPRITERPTRLQRERFALLRTPPEGLPAHLRGLVRTGDAAFNAALAQRLPALLPGGYWLVPDGRQLCLVSEVPGTPGAGTVCGSTRQSIDEGIATISLTRAERSPPGTPTRLIVGVAPDGTREALVHTHGAVAAVPVVSGVFVLRDAARAPSDYVELRR